MFERLSDGFSSVFRRLSGKGEISEKNVADAMTDVRTALLEADVHVDVVDRFVNNVMSDAVGREVTKSLKPGEEMIGIVHDRLVELLGGTPAAPGGEVDPFTGLPAPASMPTLGATDGVLRVSPGPTIVMMCGLQGSGKTTTCGKLAGYLKKRGRSVLLVAADLQRPAAVEQLHTVAESVQRDLPGGATVSFYSEPDKVAAYGKAVGIAVQVCKRGVEFARSKGIDTVILDTAGRLHVNDALMDELNQVNRTVQPHQVFLVVDAMTGQDAVTSAKSFHERLEVDGVILTKFDSDTRGGAAISVRHVTGAPVKFIGVGEKLDALEDFVPERIAGRILGMGDVVSLVERAREQVSEEDAEKLQEKMARGEMTMDDFLKQLRTLRRMGPLKQLLGLLPGVGSALKDVHIDDKQLDRVEAIVHSMTPGERRKPESIDMPRRKRIARGSGTDPNEVGQLGKQFITVSKLAKQMSSLSAMGRVKAVKELGEGGMESMLPGIGGLPNFGGLGGRRGKPSSAGSGFKTRFKKRK
jgi:signal recognition particle subunit SRP54